MVTENQESVELERKRMQKRYAGLPGNIYVHDLQYDVNLFRSRSLIDLLGYEGSDKLLVGEQMRSLVHPEDIEGFLKNGERILTLPDGKCCRYTYRIQHADGLWFWLQSEEYVLERDTNGIPIKILGYATDLTATIQQQIRLDELNRLNQFLLETSRMLIESEQAFEVTLMNLATSVSQYFDSVCDISILDKRTGVISPKAVAHKDQVVVGILRDIFSSRVVRKGEGLVGSVIEKGIEILIKEIPEEMKVGPANIDPRIVPQSLIYRPLRGSEGTIGSINLTRLTGQRPFTDTEIDQVRQLANHVSLFVENQLLADERKEEIQRRSKTEGELERSKRWAEFKVELSTLLSEVQVDLYRVLERSTQRISEFFDVVCDIQLLDRSSGNILPVAIHHQDGTVMQLIQELFGKTQLRVGVGFIGQVVETGKEVYLTGMDEDLTHRIKQSGIDGRIIPSSFLYLPLNGHSGTLGTLNLTRLCGQAELDANEAMQARELVGLLAGYIDNKLLQVNQLAEIERRKRIESKLERTTRILERNEAELRSILNAIPIYISRVNRAYQYTFLNAGYFGLGADPRSLEGRPVSDFIGQKNFDRLKHHYDRALSGETVTFDFNGRLKDGLERYFTVMLTPDRTVDGTVNGFYSCITDLTQKVEAEQAAKRTQERFETLTLNSGDAFFFHDLDQNILDVNKAASDMLGYTREELLSMKARDIDPRWAGTNFQKFLGLLGENEPQTFETVVLRKDGTEIPVEVRFVKRVERNVTYIQSLLRDRTEKKLQEQKLQRSEERLRLVFDNVEDFIATVNEDGIIESVNRTAQGVQPEDVIGGKVFDWYPDPDIRSHVEAKFREMKAIGNSFEIETTSFTGPDGTVSIYFNKYVPIFQDGSFYKVIIIIRDVTMARQKERAMMSAVLKGQEQERKRLGAELHDGIGQILSAISLDVSQASALAANTDRSQLISELDQLGSKVQTAIKEVRNISHDLMPDVLESFGLKEALKQTCSSLHKRAGIKVKFEHVDLQSKYDSTMELNIFRITQELLNNIQKHSASANVFVSLMDHGDSISLTVEDDGIGFDPNKDSSGIGLRNVASRVKTLGGQMDVESSKESGTLINIEIPKLK